MSTKQLEYVSGAVVQINSKKTGLKVQGLDEWLNISQYHPVAPLPTVGELVEVQYERTDRGLWITLLQIIGASATTTVPASDRDRQIRRQVAIKAAARLVGAFAQMHEEVKVDHVFPLADRILAWLEQPEERI